MYICVCVFIYLLISIYLISIFQQIVFYCIKMPHFCISIFDASYVLAPRLGYNVVDQGPGPATPDAFYALAGLVALDGWGIRWITREFIGKSWGSP